jgi:hypothetical protein
MRAITVWPEWSWAICRLGKDVENRTWAAPSTLRIGDELAIHAGGTFGGSAHYKKISEIFTPVGEMARRAGWRMGFNGTENTVTTYSVKNPKSVSDKVHMMARGAVVAVATFGGCIDPALLTDEKGWPWWAPDLFGWILRDVSVLGEPVDCRGRQGLWRLDADVDALVRSQLGRSGTTGSEPDESSRACVHK